MSDRDLSQWSFLCTPGNGIPHGILGGLVDFPKLHPKGSHHGDVREKIRLLEFYDSMAKTFCEQFLTVASIDLLQVLKEWAYNFPRYFRLVPLVPQKWFLFYPASEWILRAILSHLSDRREPPFRLELSHDSGLNWATYRKPSYTLVMHIFCANTI